jgi:hypothetical protein
MKIKLILPALGLVVTLLGCSIPINTSGNPPLIVTDTPVPTAASTNTSIPTVVETLAPSLTATPVPSVTDTLVPPPTLTYTPTVPPLPSPVPSSVPELSVDILRNATYTTPYFLKTVKLVNGSYTEGSGATFYSVQMLDIFAYGDLNGDGKTDAAVILAENQGGSGVFESVVAVLNQGGAPHQISSVQLGDREIIKSANISRGVIHLNMTVHGPNDPMCCPSQPEVKSFWLLGNNLWLMRVTSGPTGTEREITASYPGVWADVHNPFAVSGDVTISPFENTLNYSVYVLDGTKVTSGSLLVSSSGMGTPGTFSKAFDLSSAGITGIVIVQFKDISASDGSTLALGSAVFNLH